MRGRILCDAGWTTSLKRTSERGIESTLVRCFTLSPPAISNFLGFCGVLFWVFCLGLVCLVVWFASHGFEVNLVVCEVVCEVERPSELSWRARHGRKKNCVFVCVVFLCVLQVLGGRFVLSSSSR